MNAEQLKQPYPTGKWSTECKVEGLGSFQCFSRDMKPRIWFKYYPSCNRGWWVVDRDWSINWKHLTMQEKENLHAAYEHVSLLNHEIHRIHSEHGIWCTGLWEKK